MEKYGFVYIWYDRKRKMFYIGCHWGTEDDGYLCSSNRMRDAYRRRPKDFRRRIISRVYTDRQYLLEEEHKWFQMIKPEELGKKYYNLHQHHYGHWTADENSNKTIRERISIKTKEALANPKIREKIRIKRAKQVISEESKEKRSNTLKELFKTGFEPWNKGLKNCFSEKYITDMVDRLSLYWLVTFPDGKKEIIKNMKNFCKENGLFASNMYKVAKGLQKHHKNFTCKHFSKKEL